MARDAVSATGAAGTAFLQVDRVQVADNPGNGNGIPEVGEGARMTITLKNYGVAPATPFRPAHLAYDRRHRRAAEQGDVRQSCAARFGRQRRFIAVHHDYRRRVSRRGNFTFAATYTGGMGPLSQAFVVPIGVTTFSVTKNLDGSTPGSVTGVVGSTGVQNFRLNRQDAGSICGVQKPAPPVSAAGGPGTRHFDAYALTTCGFSTPSCASVTFSGPNSINMFSAAYVQTFNPADITQNYKADPAVSSGGPLTYSFDLPAGSSQFAIDVRDVPVLAGPSNSPYTVDGVQRLSRIVRSAKPSALAGRRTSPFRRTTCAWPTPRSTTAPRTPTAIRSRLFRRGPITLYALGSTTVQLTVTDPKGAFSQATGVVTVVDKTPPVGQRHVAIDRIPMAPKSQDGGCDGQLRRLDRQLQRLVVRKDRVGNVGGNGSGDGDAATDWEVVVDAHHVRLRAERAGNGNGNSTWSR